MLAFILTTGDINWIITDSNQVKFFQTSDPPRLDQRDHLRMGENSKLELCSFWTTSEHNVHQQHFFKKELEHFLSFWMGGEAY